MNIENEIRFVGTAAKKIIALMNSSDECKKIHNDSLMQRSIFDLNDENNWIRVRKERERTTLTLKKVIDSSSISGVQEFEITVDSYEKTNQLLEALGYKKRSVQENRREVWKVGDADVTIDTWPGIDPLVEVEAETREKVLEALQKMSVSENDGTLENVTQIYLKELGVDIKTTPLLTFDKMNHAK